MNRTTSRRIARLEAAQPESVGQWHQIIVDEGEDPEPVMAAMRASGAAQEGDNFIVRIIVTPVRGSN
jgi:hypothetical protein